MSALLDSIAAGFDALPGRDAAGLGAARARALAAALRDGIPGTRSERWKYTPLRAFERRQFAPAFSHAPDVAPTLPTLVDGSRLVFVNGRFDAGLSDIGALPEGVSVQPLSQALAGNDPMAAQRLSASFDRPDEVFARLNAALATEGVRLRVDAGTRVGTPLHAVFIGAPAAQDLALHLRHLLDIGAKAEVTLVEHHFAAAPHAHFANDLAHVHVGEGACLTHIRVQEEATTASLVRRTDAVLDREATYQRLDLELGAALSRHELNVRMGGERARVVANGVLLADGKRHLDTRLGIEHAAKDTQCDLLWRGLGAGRSRAAFHGGILIREGADGSIAELSNKNLLLSVGAEIDTQPVLEIHADEVQAAHGAAVGQIDPTAMFYLRSRGIPEAQARALLTAAFCREAISIIGDEALRGVASTALDAALSRLELA